MEPFVASAHEAVNLWSAFFTASDRPALLETARLAGFPENYSSYARCLYGLIFERRIEAVYYPQPGVPKEVLKAIEMAAEQGVEAVPFSFPLFRNDQRLSEALDALRRRLGVDPAVLEAVVQRLHEVRTVLRRYDGLQMRTAAFSSRDYVSMLAQAMDPRGDLEGLRRRIERGILDYRDEGRERWTRVGIVGLPPYRASFYEALESMRAVAVYDEWGLENNPMSPSLDLTFLYHTCSLPYGLKRRLERVQREAATRRLQAVVLAVEYLCESLKDEGYFRINLGLPVYAFENRGGDSLSSAEERGLRRLIEEQVAAP